MQKIEITLKEYKQLRDFVEKYYILSSEYNLLANAYNQIVKVEEPKQKSIGFRTEDN